MAETIKQCTGDCLKCSFQQQVYCSSQRTFQMMKNQEAIYNKMLDLEKLLSKETLINPFKEAQEGRGAENSSPENNNN